nr:MAG TPA: hypothetical protein [Caudoviricetes sp.]
MLLVCDKVHISHTQTLSKVNVFLLYSKILSFSIVYSK